MLSAETWLNGKVSTHSHPKVAAILQNVYYAPNMVSTHSHPKVAAPVTPLTITRNYRFNTQPPEGGCKHD